MDAEYIEKYERLSSLKPGRLAVSMDRKNLYLCLFVPKPGGVKDSFCTVVDLNDPTRQYVYDIDMNQQVKILPRGDKFVITV